MYDNISIKDIPLNVLRDYISNDYITSENFQKSLDLYDKLTNDTRELTDMSIENYDYIYNALLIQMLSDKYNEVFISANADVDGLRKIKLINEDRLEKLKYITKSTDNPSLVYHRAVKPLHEDSSVYLKRLSNSEIKDDIENRYNASKLSFFETYIPTNLESDNLFINIKKSMDISTDPSIKNDSIKRINDFHNDISEGIKLNLYENVDNSYNEDSFDVKYNILKDEYDAYIQLFINKYNNLNIDRSTILNENDLMRILNEKFLEGSLVQESLNSTSDSTTLDISLDENNVDIFLMNSDIMDDYNIVDRKR